MTLHGPGNRVPTSPDGGYTFHLECECGWMASSYLKPDEAWRKLIEHMQLVGNVNAPQGSDGQLADSSPAAEPSTQNAPLPIPEKAVEQAAKAMHEAERDNYCTKGETWCGTWEECLADPELWGGENFTLEETLGFAEAALRAGLEAMGARVEERGVAWDGIGVHRRLVSDWQAVEEE